MIHLRGRFKHAPARRDTTELIDKQLDHIDRTVRRFPDREEAQQWAAEKVLFDHSAEAFRGWLEDYGVSFPEGIRPIQATTLVTQRRWPSE